MSLKPPRRIFLRQKRRHGKLSTLRAVGVLAFGFLVAFGATVATFAGPGNTSAARSAAQPQPLPGHTPIMRLAAFGDGLRRPQR